LLSSRMLRSVPYCADRTHSISIRWQRWGGSRALALPEATVPIPAKILLVDDQVLVRRTLRSLLGQQPHWQVYEAHDGLAALKRAREIQPDVVVMDIVMPNMSGIAAVYELRRVVPQAKVVLISSHYTEEEAAHLARLFGDGNFIEKSQTGTKLVSTISRILPLESQAV
jgi:DNA-binding NarL/FixJ family response regulator